MRDPQTWAHEFVVTDEDIEFLNALLLEREVPLSSRTLARAVVNERARRAADKLRERFKDAVLYDPAQSYEVDQRLIFSAFSYAIGKVVNVREGDNGDYGAFDVIQVEFENDQLNTGDSPREFAIGLEQPHDLNSNSNGNSLHGMPSADAVDVDAILNTKAFDVVIERLDERLREDDSLIQVAGEWFAKELMIQTEEGHMHLAEAILDMSGGGPLTTQDVLDGIGGIGSEPAALQVFSMNYGMSQDGRFDEVGPAGEVLWYLRRMEPEQVQQTPVMLRYTPISYDRDTLDDESLELERELADEHSPLELSDKAIKHARVVLIYPHRRCGTLPLNYQAEHILPHARRTERIAITLVDAQDDEEFKAWVVRKDRYVHGLAPLYAKHMLPIGSTVTLTRDEQPGRIRVDFEAYKPRSEYVTIVSANDNRQIAFNTAKRAIGAGYDDLLLLGVDDLEGVDKLFQGTVNSQHPLASILRVLIPALGKINAQGHVHAKTLYSAVNVIRRCPPGPILATLINNPDFENAGGQYWKLS